MKTLADILENRTNIDLSPFPVLHYNGYTGEIDGDQVVFFIFYVPSKKAARQIPIPEKAQLHWAKYHPKYGWEGTIGIWQSNLTEKDRKYFRNNIFIPV